MSEVRECEGGGGGEMGQRGQRVTERRGGRVRRCRQASHLINQSAVNLIRKSEGEGGLRGVRVRGGWEEVSSSPPCLLPARRVAHQTPKTLPRNPALCLARGAWQPTPSGPEHTGASRSRGHWEIAELVLVSLARQLPPHPHPSALAVDTTPSVFPPLHIPAPQP